MSDKWFYLENYIYVSSVEDRLLLYNTLSGKYIISETPSVICLVEKLQAEENCGVIRVSKTDLEIFELRNFLNNCRDLFFGDLIDVDISSGKPIQFYPLLNLQSDISKLKKKGKRSLADEALFCLEHVIFFLNSECDKNCTYCLYGYKQTSMCTKLSCSEVLSLNVVAKFLNSEITKGNRFTFSGGNILKYSQLEDLVRLIEQRGAYSEWNLHYRNIDTNALYILPKENMRLNIIIDITGLCILDRIIDIVDCFNYHFKILIKDRYEYNTVLQNELIANDKVLYELIPLYNTANYEFFVDMCFLKEEDILGETQDMKEIFKKQKLNNNFFGEINILPNGDVYSNLNLPCLGNLNTSRIDDIVYKEMIDVNSWLKIRDSAPCNNCLFQFLCPSPSNYEYAIEKVNLCCVK